MTSGIDADLLTELNSRPINNLILLELDLESGSTRRYSEAWAAASAGLYEGRVVESGVIDRAVSDSGFNLPDDRAQVTIRDDNARTLEQVLMGSAVGSISGSAARIKLASKTLASSKWFTLFSGVVRNFSSPSSYLWAFNLARDDQPLRGLVKIPTIQSYDWPDAPQDSLGVFANVVYGKHSSAGTAVTGMVPTTYVDNVNYRYLVSFGPIAAIPAVYSDGVLQTLTTDYTIDLAFFRNGKYWSIVDFVNDQGSAEVTVDCEGLTDGGVIVNPATQLEHFLTNFVFGDWGASTTFTNSAWLSAANFAIDETFFAEAETFLSDKQIAKGSRVIGGDRKAIDVLNEWTRQLQIPSFWTYDGKIAIRPDDHTLTSTYISSPHLRQEISPEPEFRSVTFDASKLIDEVRTDYLYSAAGNDFQKSLTVKDPSKGYNSAESLQLHWRESVA